MRPVLPIAAAVLLTAGAVAIPALTQAQDAQSQATSSAPAQHYKWKRTHIDVAAMSASMSAQNPNAFSPPAAAGDNAADQQPGAINATPKTPVTSDQQTDGTATSDSGVMGNSATTGAQNSPTTPSDDSSMTAPDKSTTGNATSPQ